MTQRHSPARPSVAEHPLSQGQRALWFLHQLDPSGSAYNVHLPVRIHSPVDVDAMRRTFQKLVDRHAPLRCTFGVRDGHPFQRVARRLPVRFEVFPASGCDPRALNRLLLEKSHEPFDLEHGPVFRVALFTLNPEEHILLVSAHHIATDMWSTLVLMEEMATRSFSACALTTKVGNVAASSATQTKKCGKGTRFMVALVLVRCRPITWD